MVESFNKLQNTTLE
jgi:hypothetical protein